ncbi:hypothetical protein [Trujillonella endophytica]|uniref:Uncharacterized protein n=1 Tax=Trujillonella endophytica TaxID=673521 RepID=A0A1H8PUX3_9ACTN|nr:hypothetical protein [Trujillella endophytica]SEO45484.1 hypothetical protein SAMN05660991_00384 [Trujillella endophytica]
MDGRTWLFDPATAHATVLAHRPAGCTAVECVVSDAVWADVVGLLRWADAGTRVPAPLAAGTWWRLATGCAALLRRLPGLCAELDEPWAVQGLPGEDERPAAERLIRATGRLAGLLSAPAPVPLRRLASAVDALGAAAIAVLVETGCAGGARPAP